MKSINLIPPKHAERQLRSWLAFALIVTLAAGALAGIYYYVDSIHTQAERYLSEARDVEQEKNEFIAQAVQRVSGDRLNEFARKQDEVAAARIAWERDLLDIIRPLPQSAILNTLTSNGDRSIHIQASFRTYDEALQYIHRLEELERSGNVSVNSFAENVNETTESVPVTDADGTVLYYESKMARQSVYSIDVRVAMTEGDVADERQ